jgi:hypothetical protein
MHFLALLIAKIQHPLKHAKQKVKDAKKDKAI